MQLSVLAGLVESLWSVTSCRLGEKSNSTATGVRLICTETQLNEKMCLITLTVELRNIKEKRKNFYIEYGKRLVFSTRQPQVQLQLHQGLYVHT